ncbi:MAG: hypothetical protein ACRBM6_04440 [Geminicoccales bacterium]
MSSVSSSNRSNLNGRQSFDRRPLIELITLTFANHADFDACDGALADRSVDIVATDHANIQNVTADIDTFDRSNCSDGLRLLSNRSIDIVPADHADVEDVAAHRCVFDNADIGFRFCAFADSSIDVITADNADIQKITADADLINDTDTGLGHSVLADGGIDAVAANHTDIQEITANVCVTHAANPGRGFGILSDGGIDAIAADHADIQEIAADSDILLSEYGGADTNEDKRSSGEKIFMHGSSPLMNSTVLIFGIETNRSRKSDRTMWIIPFR